MEDEERKTVRIKDMIVCMPPKRLRPDTELLATFTLLMWPLYCQNLRLVRQGGEIKLWTMTPEMRFLSKAQPIIIEAAKECVREALGQIEDVT